MAIPDYQSIMLPLLRAVRDGRDHTIRDVAAVLAQEFGITRDEEREAPAQRQAARVSRTAWGGHGPT